MKILVTGGAGFIGSHVQDVFIGAGHEVVVLDNLYSGNREFVNEKSRFYEIDIRDSDSVQKVFEGERFDVVNHHAAQMDVRDSVANPVFDADVNILGSLNLLQSSVQTGVKQFVFASTGGAIYGEQETFPAAESHPLRPESPYGVSKLAVEKYIDYFGMVYGLTYFILRYANIYGPRQNPHGEAGVVAIFADLMSKGEQPTVNGDGKQTRDFVYVEDAVRANLAALTFQNNAIINIGTGIETDVNRIFDILAQNAGSENRPYHGPEKKGEQRRSVLDNSIAKELLEWEPSTGIVEGLAETYTYFLNKSEVPIG